MISKSTKAIVHDSTPQADDFYPFDIGVPLLKIFRQTISGFSNYFEASDDRIDCFSIIGK